jgi:hypothetical protein
MPDCSDLQVVIYAVADVERAAALDAITDRRMDLDWGDAMKQPTTLNLGDCYGARNVPLGSHADLVNDLMENAPSAVFAVWQDPYGETDGEYVAYAPGVGTYEAGCDAGGNPHTDVAPLADRLAALPAGTTVAEWLAGHGDRLLGITVLAALRHHEEALKAA